MKPTPVTRREQFLYALGEIQTLTPITREEIYLANLCGQNNILPVPVTRYEQYLYKMNGGDISVPTPVTRLEMFLYRACDYEYETPDPVTREEIYWDEYIKEYVTIKTLTGTLPLTFRTSETALRDWTIYGNNTEHEYSADHTLPLTFTSHTAGAASDWSISGNDNAGKNLLEITAETQTVSGVEFTIDAQAGTVIVDGSPSVTSAITCELGAINFAPGNYILSGCPAGGGSSNYRLDLRINKNTLYANTVDNGSGASFQVTKNTTLYVYARLYGAYGTFNDVLFEPMVRPADTSADFEPYQVGVGERVPNIFTNVGAISGYLDETGTYNPTTGNVKVTDYIQIPPSAKYITQSYVANGASSVLAPAMCFYDANKIFISGEVIKQRNPITVAVPDGAVYLRTSYRTQYTNNEIVGGQAVHGYEIPLSVNNTPQTFYIGDSPLTAGQSISKTSTGVDIAAIAGSNTITTDLYNKPSMSIEGVDYVGVGEPVNDGWQIPLTVTHYTDNIFDKDAKNTNKGYEDSTCIMWAGSIPYPYMTRNIPEDNNCFVSEKIPASPNTTYYLTDGIFKNTDNGIYSVFLWNRFRMSDYQAFPTEKTFTTGDDTKFIQLCVLKSYADTVMITTKPTETYIPHVEVNNVNVPINAPLTEGQSVSDTLTISTFEGENTIDTTMTNKPNMSITYKGG